METETSQDIWQLFYSSTEVSHQVLFTVVCFAITLVGYYAHGWFFVLADEYRFLDAYEIRSGKHRVPSGDLKWSAIKVCAFACLCSLYTFTLFSGSHNRLFSRQADSLLLLISLYAKIPQF